MWNDIDYMSEFRDFTFGEIFWGDANIKAFVNELHRRGQHCTIEKTFALLICA